MVDVYKGVVPAPCQCPASSPLTAATPSICLNISPAGQCWCWGLLQAGLCRHCSMMGHTFYDDHNMCPI